MKLSNLRPGGFTLVEIMIVVAIIGLLSAIAIPNFVRARENTQLNACINNLRQIDAAIQQYALENNAGVAAPVDGDMIAPYLNRGINTVVADIENGVVCPIDPNQTFTTSYGGGLATVADQPVCLLGGALAMPHALP